MSTMNQLLTKPKIITGAKQSELKNMLEKNQREPSVLNLANLLK
jgi:hypothetical protein